MKIIKIFDNTLEEFVKSLQSMTAARVLRSIDLLEEFGHKLGMPHSKKIAPNLFELRINGEQKIRIFYTFYKSEIILLHGFTKKTSKIPNKEMKTVLRKLKNIH